MPVAIDAIKYPRARRVDRLVAELWPECTGWRATGQLAEKLSARLGRKISRAYATRLLDRAGLARPRRVLRRRDPSVAARAVELYLRPLSLDEVAAVLSEETGAPVNAGWVRLAVLAGGKLRTPREAMAASRTWHPGGNLRGRPQEQRAEVRRLAELRTPHAAIAAATGVPLGTVGRWIVEDGLVWRNRKAHAEIVAAARSAPKPTDFADRLAGYLARAAA
jgi:DNA-directed RNA polymerase specialized sigma24 family protein